MMVLDLVNTENSDIEYKISKFPDGQQQIQIKGFEPGDDFKWEQPVLAYPVLIKSRLNSFLDLELIVCAKKALDILGFNNVNLYVPYFLGSRSDRQFEVGSNNYLKDVICPIINSLEFDQVTCLDPHSDVLEACITNFKKESNLELIRFSLFDLLPGPGFINPDVLNNIILVSPDAGASKKIYKLAEQIGYNGDIITCSKDRDTDGKLTKLVIPVSTIVNKDYIIIDDICDGGATFLQIAKTLKPRLHESNKLYLIVTHGIFSKGFQELSQYFDAIYCTNSYRDFSDYSGIGWDKNKLRQLDVY